MGRNTNAKGGFWMMVEDLSDEPIEESTEIVVKDKKELPDDEFFPDTSF